MFINCRVYLIKKHGLFLITFYLDTKPCNVVLIMAVLYSKRLQIGQISFPRKKCIGFCVAEDYYRWFDKSPFLFSCAHDKNQVL